MPFGITNSTNVTLERINEIANVSNAPEIFININHYLYDGWLYFFLLLVFVAIVYKATNAVNDQPLNNLLYAFGGASIIAFFMRAIFVMREGIMYGLLNDFQLWVFPLTTAIISLILWSVKDRN